MVQGPDCESCQHRVLRFGIVCGLDACACRSPVGFVTSDSVKVRAQDPTHWIFFRALARIEAERYLLVPARRPFALDSVVRPTSVSAMSPSSVGGSQSWRGVHLGTRQGTVGQLTGSTRSRTE